jgi:hypothetical protein
LFCPDGLRNIANLVVEKGRSGGLKDSSGVLDHRTRSTMTPLSAFGRVWPAQVRLGLAHREFAN